MYTKSKLYTKFYILAIVKLKAKDTTLDYFAAKSTYRRGTHEKSNIPDLK